MPLTGTSSGFFLVDDYVDPTTGHTHDLYAIAVALCAQAIPTTTNPVTGKVSPGANDAGAVNCIDLFMAAFQDDLLASGLVGNNPIWLNGRFSGRYHYGDCNPADGNLESTTPVADDFEASVNSSGSPSAIEFLALTPAQAASWYLRIYGAAPSPEPGWWPSWASSAWLVQATPGSSQLIPGAQPLSYWQAASIVSGLGNPAGSDYGAYLADMDTTAAALRNVTTSTP